MALFNWDDNQGIGGCPEGYRWSVAQRRCIPKFGTETIDPNDYKQTPKWGGEMSPDPLAESVPTVTKPDEYEMPETIEKEDYSGDTSGLPITGDYDPVISQEPIVPEEPTQLYELDQITADLGGWLTAAQSQATENGYWNTKMDRLTEQYEETKAQLMEDLNVRGLYYSGARGDKLQEHAEDFQRIVAEEESKFQYERFNRDVQRYGMAMQYALGARAQEIQWALGKGQLDLQQLDLALQETLGITALQLQEQGLLNDFIIGMYNVGISEETNQIARDQMWLNTVALLRQMGIEETEIQGIWNQITGNTPGPPT